MKGMNPNKRYVVYLRSPFGKEPELQIWSDVSVAEGITKKDPEMVLERYEILEQCDMTFSTDELRKMYPFKGSQ